MITMRGFKCLIYGPAFSGRAFNSYGSISERNNIILHFNQEVRKKLKNNKNAYYFSLDSILIGDDAQPRLESE